MFDNATILFDHTFYLGASTRLLNTMVDWRPWLTEEEARRALKVNLMHPAYGPGELGPHLDYS
ncbi:MAG: hypothetical protein DRN96_08345, partial [Thermoproteota archaeon]